MIKSLKTFLSVSCLAILASMARADAELDRVITTLLAEQFGISTKEVATTHTTSKMSWEDLGTVYSASHYGHTRADTVWRLRDQGLGWGEVAHRIGMQPGTFNKLRKQGAFDSDKVWNKMLSDRFDVPVSEVKAVRQRSPSLQDAIGSIVVGRKSHRSPKLVIEEYRQHRDWEAIKTKYDVSFTDWRKHTKNALKKHVPPHYQTTRVKVIKPKIDRYGHKDNGKGKKGSNNNGQHNGNHKGSAGKGHKKT